MLSCVRRLALLLLLTSINFAEMPRPIELPPIPKLPNMTAESGYIFSGTVKSVQPIGLHSTNRMPVMRITFQVEHGFSGVKSGQVLVIHECMGVWQEGDRYRPGQRVMLFLYPPSKLGLTSPVGGMSGRFNVDSGGRIIIDPGRASSHPGTTKPIRIRPEDFARAIQSLRGEL